MANYTITQNSSRMNVGSNVSSTLTNESDRTLYIQPNTGYVVAAKDFKAPDVLQAGISSIEITDTLKAYDNNNEVQVVVNFDPSFVVTADNNDFSLGITGEASLYVPNLTFDYESEIDFYLNIVETAVNCTIEKIAINTELVTDSSLTHVSGTVNTGFNNRIFSYQIKANEGFEFTSIPSLSTSSNVAVRPLFTSTSKDSDGRIIQYNFNISYYNEVNINQADNLTLEVEASTTAIPSSAKEISAINFGSSQVKQEGEYRFITLSGTVGSKFNLNITRVSDSFVVTNITNGEILSGGKYLVNGETVSNVQVFIPQSVITVNSKLGNDAFNLTLTAGTDTTLSTLVPSSTPTYVINQYANPIIWFRFIEPLDLPNTTFTSGTQNTYIEGRPNKDVEDIEFLSPEDYNFAFNVVYTTTATALNIVRQPEHYLRYKVGTVLSNDLDRVSLSTEGIPTTLSGQWRVFQKSNPFVNLNTVPLITAVNSTNGYIDTSIACVAADNDSFGISKTDFQFPERMVPTNQGGDGSEFKVNITGFKVEQVTTQSVRFTGSVSVQRFGVVPNTDTTISNYLFPYFEFRFAPFAGADALLTETT
jgi:hypothetical protein